jgi:peptidoglycan/xylan/chitin deacetylase (PgdA/CDA1 family)
MEERMNRNSKLWALCALIMGILGWLLIPSSAVPILAYHQISEEADVYSVDPQEFEEQMRYLVENGYQAVSLQELFDSYAGRITLPAKPVVITFDDGYVDNYTAALPIMERYGMRATVFIIINVVGQPDYLSWQQIEEMSNRHTEIGSHTMNHVALSEITPTERLLEITASKALLEQRLGKPVEFLAYPYGKFDVATEDSLRQAGYRGACSGVAGLNFSDDNPYTLKRINVPRPRYGLLEFRLRLLRAELVSKLQL